MSKLVDDTNEYLNKQPFSNDIFRPRYHFSPKVGWINDPHGFNYFNGKFHMFFQYNPYGTQCNKMFWGHVMTEDFVHFSDIQTAIGPDKDYDNAGCWSGSSIVKDGVLYLFYTGFSLHEDGKYYQVMSVATSTDGINFTKSELNPLIDTDMIPEEANIYDFRDPCVFEQDGKYYVIIGSKKPEKHEALLCLYESMDLLHWSFKKILVKSNQLGSMFECPNLIRYEDENYIVTSPQDVPMKDDSFFNVSSCVYFRLPKDFVNNDVTLENPREIDHGFEYYAPNVYDPEKLLVAWHQLWGRRYYLAEIGLPYVNNFTLFKKIERVENGELRFIPLSVYKDRFVREDKFNINLPKNYEVVKTFGKHFHMDVNVKSTKNLVFNMKLTKNNDEFVLVTYDVNEKRITLDRTSLKEQLFGVDNTPSTKGIRFLNLKEIPDVFKFEVYIDSECIEIFMNDYKDSFSLLSFSKGDDVSFTANKDTKIEVIKQDIEID